MMVTELRADEFMVLVSQFERTMARWRLSDEILNGVISEVEKKNVSIDLRQQITVTAPVNLREQFEVYRQPEGASNAKKVLVAWADKEIQVSTSDKGFEKRFAVTERNDKIELAEISVDQLVQVIVDQIS